MEARVGIEPAYDELQSTAWPLCHRAFVFACSLLHKEPAILGANNSQSTPFIKS